MIQLIIILCFMSVLFIVQQKFYGHFWLDNLDVQMHFQEAEIPEGENGNLQFVITNAKKLPLPMLMVKFQTSKYLEFAQDKGNISTDQFYHNDVFEIGKEERVLRTLQFTGVKRGYFKIRNIDLTSSDLFMSKQFHASFQPDESVYILPKPFESREFTFLMQQLNGEMITKRNLYEDPFEIRGIREYQPYDNMKSINWKATAKTGRYMVNQKNYTAPKSVRIFMDLEDTNILKKQDSIEDCIRIGAGLAKYLLEQGIKVSYYSNALDIHTGDPMICSGGKGPKQLSRIMRSLARLDTEKTPQPFQKMLRGKVLTDQDNTYTCFISPNHYEDLTTTVQEYAKQGHGYTWLYPSTASPDLDQFPISLRQQVKIIRI